MALLAWYNLVFLLPLLVGIVLGLSMAAGGDGGHGDADMDVDHDVPAKALAVLGVGKVPFSIVLASFLTIFGGVGVTLNQLMSDSSLPGELYVWPVMALSAVASLFGTMVVTRLVHRFLPSTESYASTKRSLLGRMGTLVLSADSRSGLAQVQDQHGNLMQITCRTRGEDLQKGKEIIVLSYDEDLNVYTISASEAE